jgi:hypothetical protein
MDPMIKLLKFLLTEPLLYKMLKETLFSLTMSKKVIFGECAKPNKTVSKIGLNLLLLELNTENAKLFSG